MSPQLLMVLAMALPFAATFGVLASGRNPNLREGISLTAGALLFLVVLALYQILQSGAAIEFTVYEWLPGITLAFSLEASGVLFALIASFLWIVTTVYAIGYMRGHGEQNQTRFFACFAIAISAVMGIAFAENLFTLFIFYEVLTLSTYPLVTHAGTEKARRGGRTYLTILLSTSIVFFLPAIIITQFTAGTLSFRLGGVFEPGTSLALLSVLLVLFIFGIGKAAMMPFHRWLPAAMVAPTPVSALLHAVAVVKAGVFTVFKVGVFIFGLETLAAVPATEWLLYLAGAAILLSSIVAMRQDNLKARLAYSTVSQLGYITLGVLLATQTAAMGSAMHIATHAFGKITLFFCAGAIMVAAHKSEISQMRGLGRQMPITMIAFFIGSLSIIGLPPTGGTWSKWYLLVGTLEAGQLLLMAVLMVSSLLNIAYLLPIPVRAFLPPAPSATHGHDDHHDHDGMHEAPLPSLLAIVVTALACFVLFFYPQPLFALVSAIFNGV